MITAIIAQTKIPGNSNSTSTSDTEVRQNNNDANSKLIIISDLAFRRSPAFYVFATSNSALQIAEKHACEQVIVSSVIANPQEAPP